MAESDVFSALKLRASYGVNGNAGIGNYDWRSSFAFTTSYNGIPGSAQTSVGNPNLTWEQNKPLDIGLEVGLFKNRIILETDYYIRKTDKSARTMPTPGDGGGRVVPAPRRILPVRADRSARRQRRCRNCTSRSSAATTGRSGSIRWPRPAGCCRPVGRADRICRSRPSPAGR